MTPKPLRIIGQAIAIVLHLNMAMEGHGFRLEWKRSGEFTGYQKPIQFHYSWNRPETDWPPYVALQVGINSMALFAFPKGNLSESHHLMELRFDSLTFHTSHPPPCTNEFMMVCAIEEGVLRLVET